jgi:pSer/pThr/pTyr-binding forkhead associated (FHA) protein
MDETRQPHDADGLAGPGPNWRIAPAAELPPDFFPLRLVLQPSGAIIELTRPDVVVGRHSTADVRLPLPDVSRRHCRCLFSDGRWHALDLHSLNGLWVNGEPVPQAVLNQGDVLGIGGFTFTVDLSARQTDPVTESAADDAVRGVIFKALPLPDDHAKERRRAS